MSRMLEFLVNACLLPAHHPHFITDSSRPSWLKNVRISATPCALVVISLYALSATACTKAAISSKFQEFLGQPRVMRVVLMPLDIELSELSAGGHLEPKAEWTVKATEAFTSALEKKLNEKNAKLIVGEIPENDPKKAHTYYQLIKLNDVLAQTVMAHHFNAQLRLPTKNGELDWNLGPGVQVLREDYDADYALFIDIQDVYVSNARIGLVLLAAGLQLNPFMLMSLPGFQEGYISLVDLETGDLVWFYPFSRRTGDLRDHDSALDVAEDLLEDMHDEP